MRASYCCTAHISDSSVSTALTCFARANPVHHPRSLQQHVNARVISWVRKEALRRRVRFRFKQPRLLVLAAQSVRGLPVSREPREAMERWEAPGHQWAPLRRVVSPPRAARQPRAPKARRSASQRSTTTRASTVPGRPGPASSRSVRRRTASRKRPLIDRTGNIYRTVGITSIGIFRFEGIIFVILRRRQGISTFVQS